MILAKKTSSLIRFTRRNGIGPALRLGVDRTGRRLCGLRVIEFVWLAPEKASAPEPKGTFTSRFLTAEEVERFQADPVNDLTLEFAERVASGKHFCFAALDGDRLAAYGWYALEQVEPEDCFGIGLRLPTTVAYMYKGLTRPEYRGQRLHGFLMCRALQELKSVGVARLISSVDWTNNASLKSCARIGYDFIGRVILWQQQGQPRIHVPRQARQFGVEYFAGEAPAMSSFVGA